MIPDKAKEILLETPSEVIKYIMYAIVVLALVGAYFNSNRWISNTLLGIVVVVVLIVYYIYEEHYHKETAY